MKKQILLWFLEKLNLPYHKKLYWQIKLTGRLGKQDFVYIFGKNIDIFKYDKSNPHVLIKHIELIPETGRSVIFTSYGTGEVQEENMEYGLIGII